MRPLSIACAAVLLMSACQQDRTAPAADIPPAADAPQVAAATPELEPNRDQALMDYICEGGHRIAIVGGGDIARVTLSDNRTVDLQRSADQSPPLFDGEALEFVITSDGGMLGQDEGGGFPCKSAV
ncbi:MAG: hypothetical protein ACREPE_09645 [Lysobacter sp.]